MFNLKKYCHSKNAFGLPLTIMGIIMLSISILFFSKLFLSILKETNILNDNLKINNIVENEWTKLINEDFQNQNQRINTYPTDSWGYHYEENVIDNYQIRITYKKIGKYEENETCNTSDTPSELDTVCREINISIKNNLSFIKHSFNPILISSNAGTTLPLYSIIPYYGDLSKLSSEWQLCDGTNGTPDLRNRFLTGAGNLYNIGDIGGEKEVTLKNKEIGSHYHYYGLNNYNNQGNFATTSEYKSATNFPWSKNTIGLDGWNGHGHGSSNAPIENNYVNLITSLATGINSSAPHENRPPYYATYYIMKIK